MTFAKTGLSRGFLAAGILLLSASPLMAATPSHKGEPRTAEKSAPAAPAKVTPAPVAPGPASGPTIATRKGRGHF